MKIESDQKKSDSNLRKHGVTFEEGASVLLDPLALVREDNDSEGEQRLVALGMSSLGRLLLVVYTMRDDAIRLISARRATKTERKHYD